MNIKRISEFNFCLLHRATKKLFLLILAFYTVFKGKGEESVRDDEIVRKLSLLEGTAWLWNKIKSTMSFIPLHSVRYRVILEKRRKRKMKENDPGRCLRDWVNIRIMTFIDLPSDDPIIFYGNSSARKRRNPITISRLFQTSKKVRNEFPCCVLRFPRRWLPQGSDT